MKTLLSYLLVGLLFLGIGVLLTQQCQEPEIIDNSQEIEQNKRDYAILQNSFDSLQVELDSIKSQRQKVIIKTVYKIASIDSSIAKDSLNAISEYRKALVLNGELPEGTTQNTLREIGIGARLMTDRYGLKLELKDCDNEVANLLNQTKVLISQKEGLAESNSLYGKENKSLRIEIKDANSFLRSPALWFGIGGASAILVIFLSGLAK